MKRNDTLPVRRITLKQNGTPKDTTGYSSVTFQMKKQASADPLVTRTAAFVTPRTGGQIDVTFLTADVDTEGTYDYEVKCLTAGGGQETFPNGEGGAPTFGELTLVPDLDNA